MRAQAENGGRLSSREGDALDLRKVGFETETPTKAGTVWGYTFSEITCKNERKKKTQDL